MNRTASLVETRPLANDALSVKILPKPGTIYGNCQLCIVSQHVKYMHNSNKGSPL